MDVFCIDIGNTHTHFGVAGERTSVEPGDIATISLDDPDGGLAVAVREFLGRTSKPAVAFCSVVPEANERLRAFLKKLGLPDQPFQLTCEARLAMRITYPRPAEIGQDRLANAVAATAFFPLPCIVIDMGTAVTFDIVTASGGYEGGIIAPGLRIMTQYLHQQTALLPDIDEDFNVEGAIGKSTRDAMKIGCLLGFEGMIGNLLDAVTRELKSRGEASPALVTTGGAARFLPSALRAKLIAAPDLTLRGLAHAYQLNAE